MKLPNPAIASFRLRGDGPVAIDASHESGRVSLDRSAAAAVAEGSPNDERCKSRKTQ
jgi:hypothetical protein